MVAEVEFSYRIQFNKSWFLQNIYKLLKMWGIFKNRTPFQILTPVVFTKEHRKLTFRRPFYNGCHLQKTVTILASIYPLYMLTPSIHKTPERDLKVHRKLLIN